MIRRQRKTPLLRAFARNSERHAAMISTRNPGDHPSPRDKPPPRLYHSTDVASRVALIPQYATPTRPHEAEKFIAQSMRPANRQPHRLQFVRRRGELAMSWSSRLTGARRSSPHDSMNIATQEFKANPYPFYAPLRPKRRFAASHCRPTAGLTIFSKSIPVLLLRV